MTTVDLYIDPESGGPGWVMHNGLGGPATRLGGAIWSALLAGELEAVGQIHSASYKARITGGRLAQIMDGLDLDDARGTGATPAQVRRELEPETVYLVELIEF